MKVPLANQIMLFALVVATTTYSVNAYDIGCIYPKAMPDPIEAHDIM